MLYDYRVEGNPDRYEADNEMLEGFWPALLIIFFIAAWVLTKVIHYARKSEQQWRDVDKSKLKEWQDDEW